MLMRERSRPVSPGIPLSLHSSGVLSEAPSSAAATKGTSNAPDQDMLRLEDADATVETLLLMEYADLGTLDQTVTSGKLKGDLVSLSMASLYFFQPVDVEAEECLPASVVHAPWQGTSTWCCSMADLRAWPNGYLFPQRSVLMLLLLCAAVNPAKPVGYCCGHELPALHRAAAQRPQGRQRAAQELRAQQE